MPYSEKQLVKAPMKPSPSLIYNNLTLCAGSLVYAHLRQACTLALSGVTTSGVPVAVRKVDSPHSDVIHGVTAVSHNAATWLVLATEGGIQVWDKTLTHLLHVWALPAAADLAPRHSHFARGVAINVTNDGVPNVCFGTSSGAVWAMPLDEADGKFRAPSPLPPHHTSPITAVSSPYQSRQGQWTEDLGCWLVTADEEGGMAVWEGLATDGYRLLLAIPPTGTPVVSLAVRSDHIVAARLDGSVQVYGMRDGKLRADIGSHSRLVSALALHPSRDVVASVAEDGTLAVWSLPLGGNKPECLLSVCWLHAMLTGVAFCGPSADDVAVVAYDTDELHVYKH